MTSEYESHPAFCEDSDGLCMIKHERDAYKKALEDIMLITWGSPKEYLLIAFKALHPLPNNLQ